MKRQAEPKAEDIYSREFIHSSLVHMYHLCSELEKDMQKRSQTADVKDMQRRFKCIMKELELPVICSTADGKINGITNVQGVKQWQG